MYNFVRSYVKQNFNWVLKDISTEALDDVLANYQTVRLVVTWDTVPTIFEIHGKDNRNAMTIPAGSTTINTWLSSFVTPTLVPTETIKQLSDVSSVTMTDLHDHPVTVGRGSHKYAADTALAPGTAIDLVIYNQLPAENMESMYNLGKNAVLCVNGRMLNTVHTNDRVYGINAVVEADADRQQILSVLDFTEIGGCDKIKTNDSNVTEMVRTLTDELVYVTSFIVDVGISMRGKTPLISLDGYLYYGKDNIKAISDTQVKITVKHEVAIKNASRRMHQELEFVAPANDRLNGFDILTFNAEAYVKLDSSFIILVNTDELCISTESVGTTNIPGFYTHYRAPRGILMNELGKMMPYYINEYNQFTVCLSVADNTERVNMIAEYENFGIQQKHSQAELVNMARPNMQGRMIDLYVL